MNTVALIHGISVWAIPAIVAITFHEAAHGYVAWKLGDDTAYRLGRVSSNPFRHVDPFGTILMPALLLLARSPFLFGWAKPVPVNFGRLNHPRRDMVWVAAAGPGINLALATLSALLVHIVPFLPGPAVQWAQANLVNSIEINLVLAVFNMIPIPPLDGGRVAVGILPHGLAYRLARLERVGLLLIILAMFILPMLGREIGVRLDVFGWLMDVPVTLLFDVIVVITGHG